MHVTRDLSHEVYVIRELFVCGREKFRFPEVFPITTDSKKLKTVPWTPWRQCHFRHVQSSELEVFDILRSRSCDMCKMGWTGLHDSPARVLAFFKVWLVRVCL